MRRDVGMGRRSGVRGPTYQVHAPTIARRAVRYVPASCRSEPRYERLGSRQRHRGHPERWRGNCRSLIEIIGNGIDSLQELIQIE